MAKGTGRAVVEVGECLTESWALKLRTSLRIVVGTPPPPPLPPFFVGPPPPPLSLSVSVNVRHGITTIESKVLSVCNT